MFGYACDETQELMPLPISLAHKLAKQLAEVRKSRELPYLCPDGKTQVSVEYINGVPKHIDTIVISTQHLDTVNMTVLYKDINKYVIEPIIPEKMMNEDTKIYINPTGDLLLEVLREIPVLQDVKL